jgi:hypothetical protein
MKIDWTDLQTELKHWADTGLHLPLWWRDDDAVEHTPALDRLIALSYDVDVRVHIAVIPYYAKQNLSDVVLATEYLIPVVHGWAHRNTAPLTSKKSEFGTFNQAAAQKAKDGLTLLHAIFGDRLAPMFVPPWNRVDPALFPDLARAGFTTVSTATPRAAAHPVPGLTQINTHIDPIDWRGTRGLVDPQILVARIVALLRDRRNGVTDNAEPLGYLTHHLVHTQDIWDFSKQFFAEMQAGPTVLFTADQGSGAQ